MANAINTDTANASLFWSKPSANPSTNTTQKEFKDFQSQDIETIKQQIKQQIETWIQNPSGAFDFDSDFLSPANIYSFAQNGRINHDTEWESSKKYSNVSEEQYKEARDYLFWQMDEILLSTYLDEGGSKLFATLLIQATIRNHFADIDETTESIESSATNFVNALNSKDKKEILKATAELEEDLGTLSSADWLIMPNLTQFFTLADSKIPQENMQKIIDSLGVMRKFIDENLSIHKTGSITLRSGTTISKSVDDNDAITLKVSLSQNKMENLLLCHTQQNFNTLLQMSESKDKTTQDSKQISDMLLAQLLRKENREKI